MRPEHVRTRRRRRARRGRRSSSRSAARHTSTCASMAAARRARAARSRGRSRATTLGVVGRSGARARYSTRDGRARRAGAMSERRVLGADARAVPPRPRRRSSPLPALATFGLALTDYDLIRSPNVVGLDNFRELVDDEVFRIALVNSLVFAAVAVPAAARSAALGLALLLHRGGRGVGVARSAVVLPTIVPELAYGLLWLWLFNPLYGPDQRPAHPRRRERRHGARRLPPQWLTRSERRAGRDGAAEPVHDRRGVRVCCSSRAGPSLPTSTSWRRSRTRPWWDVFRRITLPLMLPVLVLLGLRDVVLSLQLNLVPALVVTEGGPPDYATTYLACSSTGRASSTCATAMRPPRRSCSSS